MSNSDFEARREARQQWQAALKEERARDEIETARRRRHPKGDALYRYGLTVAAYEALVKGQSGLCAGCGMALAPADGVIDHCHLTDKVRGILHLKCNSVLGFAQDSPGTLRALADYLERQYAP